MRTMMRTRCALVAAALMACAPAAVCAGARAGQAAEVPEFKVTAGPWSGANGRSFDVRVPVVNRSAARVSIDRAVPKCSSCTRVLALPKQLDPDETGHVDLAITPGSSRGTLGFGATLVADGAPWAVATVEAIVLGIELRYADAIDLGCTAAGTPLERALQVRTVAPSDAVLSASIEGLGFDAEVCERPEGMRQLADGVVERQWRTTVRFMATEAHAEGRVDARISLRLASAGGLIEASDVAVRARVQPRMLAYPSSVFLGVVVGDAPVEREILVPGLVPAEDVSAAGARVVSTRTQGGLTGVTIAIIPSGNEGFRQGQVRIRALGAEHAVEWGAMALSGEAVPGRRPEFPPGVAPELEVDARAVASELGSADASSALFTHEGYARRLGGCQALMRAEASQARSVLAWLGAVRESADPRDVPRIADIRAAVAFKRGCFHRTDSVMRESTWVAGELVRSTDPAIQGHPWSQDRVLRRLVDGPIRFTASCSVGASSDSLDAVATDGAVEAAVSGQSEPMVGRAHDYGAHRHPAEWEAVAGMLGDTSRGTAQGDFHDLADALAGHGPGAVTASWDRDAGAGPGLLRLEVGLGSPMTVWLDPSRGLAPVRRTQVIADARFIDRIEWAAEDFSMLPSGIELPGRCMFVQHRRDSAAPPGGPERVVYRRDMRKLRFDCGPESREGELSAERVVIDESRATASEWSEVIAALGGAKP